MDDTLLASEDVAGGSPHDAVIIVNSTSPPSEVREQLSNKTARLFTVDATGIALDTIKRDIPNTPMLGAFLKVVPLVPVQKMEEQVKNKILKKIGQEKTLNP